MSLKKEKIMSQEAVKISKIKLSNYNFFYGNFELPVNGKNLLVYGENGSGKSTIYKALELLTKDNFTDLDKSLNVFTDNENVEIEFEFTNNKPSLLITSDVEQKPEGYEFLNGLSVFSPLLDYKKLLKVHYSPDINGNKLNLYSMFRQLLKDYPIAENRKLGDISKNIMHYLDTLERILEEDLMTDVNSFLKKYFKSDLEITSFETKLELDEESQKGIPYVLMNVDYKQNKIEKYHTFLNEARLSALAISIYFVAIKKLETLQEESLKILVLDDLLISLDMNNRIKLFEMLKNEFNDFQILFFTHEKELFEFYKNKMDWQKYELYLDDNEECIPNVILKKGKSEIERAKEYYAKKEYEPCALLLRKAFEKLIKEYLTKEEQRDSNCNELNMSGLIGKSISKSTDDLKDILKKLDFDRTHILNPLSHNDERAIYSEELKSALLDLEKLKKILN
jgi:ABC-type lipoprotein export system ATPase subunit